MLYAEKDAVKIPGSVVDGEKGKVHLEFVQCKTSRLPLDRLVDVCS